MASEAERAEAASERCDSPFDQATRFLSAVSAAVTRDGTIPAMSREAVKDVRNTIHEVFFGQGEGRGEIGAPLNPTQGEVAADRQEEPASPLLSSDDLARGSEPKVTVHGPAERAGSVFHQEGTNWTDRILSEREKENSGGADQNERAKGRSLPEEERQKEQEQEQERGERSR